MIIRSRFASFAFKALLALSAWAGLALQCGVFTPSPNFSAMRYYTLLSNLLVALYFTWAAVRVLRGGRAPLARFKGALTMGITVTGLVFHLMLSRSLFSMGGTAQLANQLLHTVTPVMTVLDYVLFDEKGKLNVRSPFLWTALPNVYFVLATLYGFFSGDRFYGGARFPYYFINFDALGFLPVMGYVLGLNVAFIALGFLFFAFDRLTARA